MFAAATQALPRLTPMPAFADAMPQQEVPIADLMIRRLESAQEIAEMAALRRQIDLAAAASVDPHFIEHEKKEIN